ncbi:hypothetical protein N479_16555 [Pseudoalteromonas luteoviolacea S4054]|uniref:Uncharacterized protein n=1 Tax=Pseudoalteromonas luteoviolacea S4054 TaxID=1129367 RepID=A0A0F6A9S6_9GAMM|nr:hypothetical protein N479_16555 [Pseudoalteromonas luteoviolacea S4054]
MWIEIMEEVWTVDFEIQTLWLHLNEKIDMHLFEPKK